MRSKIFSFRRGSLTLWLILLVIAVGVAALAVFGVLDLSKIKESIPGQSNQIIEDQQVQSLQSQGTSDEVVDIEQDLNSTDLDCLDQELSEVDQALSQ